MPHPLERTTFRCTPTVIIRIFYGDYFLDSLCCLSYKFNSQNQILINEGEGS